MRVAVMASPAKAKSKGDRFVNSYLLTMTAHQTISGPWRDPKTIKPIAVCPTCKMPTSRRVSPADDGFIVEKHRCFVHGDVIPVLSAVCNADWSVA